MGAEEDKKLFKAVEIGNINEVRKALDAGANHAAIDNGRTPLSCAAYHGQTKAAQVLLDCGADVNAKNEKSNTPLYLAATNGNTETAALLIGRGAEVNAKSSGGSTPLHAAVFRYSAETVALLINHGADVNAKDEGDNTPLHIAAGHGCVKAAQVLIEHGANPHMVNNDGKNAATVAKDMRKNAIAETLAEAAINYVPPPGPQALRIRAGRDEKTWEEGI